MKRIFLFLFVLMGFSATAQVYKPFKVNVSLGYAKALGEGLSGGVLFAVEPKYGLGDNFDVGVRLEAASIARGVTVSGNTTTGSVGTFASGLLTGTYLIGSGDFRPFIGLGAGIYNVGSSGTIVLNNGQTTPENVVLSSETKFGFMVRAGFKTGHFVAGVEYNAVPTTAAKLSNTTIDTKNAYLGIKVGLDIGGGRL